MAKGNYEKHFYSSILKSIDRNDSHNFYNEMINAIKSGNLEVFQRRSREQLSFDATWINQIKDYLRYLENIVRNPRIYMQAIEEVTPIERAKKINARSIQHLSSHVQNVQELRADGTIVPSKVLSTTFEDTYAIYENRFIMTLISKLAAFVEVRYSSILESIKSYQSDEVVTSSTFKWRNYDIETKIELKVREEIIDEVSKKNQELLDQIVVIRNYAKGFMNSSFYQTMKEKTRPVTPPILRTNIITKSVDYNSCLKLWLFLDSYRELGVDLKVMDKDMPFDQDFINEVCDMIMLNYSLVAVNQDDRSKDFELLPYKMRKEKVHKENPLLVAKDNPELDNKIDPNEPTISEYFYQRVKKNYKTEFTKEVNSGISFNKSFLNVYRKMLKIENGVQEELLDSMEEHLPRTASINEKRKARYHHLKKCKRMYQSLILAKQQDIERQKKRIDKINKDLEKYEKEDKEFKRQLTISRKQQLRDYRLNQKINKGEMTIEEALTYKIKDDKKLNRKPKKVKEEVQDELLKSQIAEEENRVKSQKEILLERLNKAKQIKRTKEVKVNNDKFNVIEHESYSSSSSEVSPDNRTKRVMAYLKKAREAKKQKEESLKNTSSDEEN